MKKESGFTLVELLAVIVILGVLATIAIGATTKFLKDSQRKTYQEYEDNMKTAAENYLLEHPDEIPLADAMFQITLDDLIQGSYSGILEDPEVSNSTCDGYVTAKRLAGSNLKLDYQACLRCHRYTSDICQ